jgi:hypothetical protein
MSEVVIMLIDEKTIQRLEAEGLSFTKVEDDGPNQTDKIVEAIDRIGRQLIEAMKKVGAKPDNSEIISVVNESLALLRSRIVSMKPEKREPLPKEWTFEVERDSQGRMTGGKFTGK